MQLNALNQFISLNTTSGIANLAVEPNTGGSSNGEVIFGYGHLNASDRRLKTNIRRVPEQHVQRLFDEVEPQYYDRIGGGKDQLGFIAQDVQAAGKLGAAGEEQVGQAGLRGDGPVDTEGVVDQDALHTALDREPGRGRVAAHQRRFEPEVADDLQVGGDAAVGAEGARGGRAAHGELGDVRRGGVQGACRRHRDVPVHADASVGEAGQQRAVFLADRYQGVLDLEIAGRALQLGRLHEGGGGATPPLFSRAVTRPSMAPTSVSRVLTRPSMDVTVLPRELKVATRG